MLIFNPIWAKKYGWLVSLGVWAALFITGNLLLGIGYAPFIFLISGGLTMVLTLPYHGVMDEKIVRRETITIMANYPGYTEVDVMWKRGGGTVWRVIKNDQGLVRTLITQGDKVILDQPGVMTTGV